MIIMSNDNRDIRNNTNKVKFRNLSKNSFKRKEIYKELLSNYSFFPKENIKIIIIIIKAR